MKNKTNKIAVVEDDKMIGNIIAWELDQNPDNEIELFTSGEELLEQDEFKPDLVILDYQLNGIDKYAVDGLQILKELEADTPTIVMSAQTDIKVAVDCIRNGACNYIVKDDLLATNITKSVNEVLDYERTKNEIKRLKRSKRIDLIRIVLFIGICSLAVYFLQ